MKVFLSLVRVIHRVRLVVHRENGENPAGERIVEVSGEITAEIGSEMTVVGTRR